MIFRHNAVRIFYLREEEVRLQVSPTHGTVTPCNVQSPVLSAHVLKTRSLKCLKVRFVTVLCAYWSGRRKYDPLEGVKTRTQAGHWSVVAFSVNLSSDLAVTHYRAESSMSCSVVNSLWTFPVSSVKNMRLTNGAYIRSYIRGICFLYHFESVKFFMFIQHIRRFCYDKLLSNYKDNAGHK
jgi:hypothetical protein